MKLSKGKLKSGICYFPSYFDVKKRYGAFIFSLRSEFDVFVLTIKIISEFFDVMFQAKK